MKDKDHVMQRKRTYNSLWRLYFMYYFIGGFIPVNIENLLVNLPGTTNFGIGVVVASSLLIGSISILIFGYYGGRLSEKFSRKKILSITIAIWIVMYSLVPFSVNYFFYLTCIIIASFGGGAFLPISFSIISDLYSPTSRGQKYGTMQLGLMLGNGIGIIFGGLLGNYTGPIGWRFAYLIGSLFALITLIFYILRGFEPETGKAEPELKNLEKGVKYDYKITFNNLIQLFKHKSVIGILIFILCQGISASTLGTWGIFYITTKIIAEDPGLIATTLYLIAGIGSLPGSIIGGKLGDSYAESGKLRGRVLIPFIGILLGVTLLFGFYLIPFFTSTTIAIIFSWIFYLALGFIGNFLANLHQGNTFAIYSEVTVPELRSTANSFNGLMANFGAIIGNLLISSLIESNLAYLPLAISLVLSVQVVGGFFWLIPYFSYPREFKELRDLMKRRKLELDGRTH